MNRILHSIIVFALTLAAAPCMAAAISKTEAMDIARKAASPFCAEERQCVITARKRREHWAVTLQAVVRPASAQMLEAGNYRLVELDEHGNVLGIVHGK